MKFSAGSFYTLLFLGSDALAFSPNNIKRNVFAPKSSCVTNIVSFGLMDDNLEQSIQRQTAYKPGKADSELARRYGSLAGADIKTTSEAFADFTQELGSPINALYKSAVGDIVGTTHLITVTARFQRDAIWSLGIITFLDLVLKNYPEKDIAAKIKTSLFNCIGMDLSEIEKEAASLSQWATGKSKDDIKAALSGEDGSIVAAISKNAKADKYWMYSKWFGVGLVKLMEMAGVEQDKESCYPVMEEWMQTMDKPFFTACNDSDQYFRTKSKLEMLETLMKEVEIREKKRLAQRLEEKAEAALARAERDSNFKKEEEMEKEKASVPVETTAAAGESE